MSVKDIMHAVTYVDPNTSVLEVARVMRDKNIGSVLLKIDSVRWGIVTERDIIVRVVSRDIDPKTVKA